MIRPYHQQSDFYGRKFYGVYLLKSPLDLWSAQEIIWECKPRTIVETGTYYGGSALYYATLLDGMKEGKVVTVDIEPQGVADTEKGSIFRTPGHLARPPALRGDRA